jgi:AcrR family transcriptional regulator
MDRDGCQEDVRHSLGVRMKVRTDERRTAIIEAAAALFAEMGYERASMNELVKRLGGSKSTIYGYFPSKEVLFAAVVRAFATGHLSDATKELSSGVDGRVALEATLMRFAERMLLVTLNDDRALAVYRMVVAEAGHSDVGQLFHESGPSESISALATLFASAMDRGYLRKADPRVIAMQFTALVTAEIGLRVYQRDPPRVAIRQIRQMVKRAVDVFFEGAAAR